MSASGALDDQKVLSKLIGKTLNLEISCHERYCIYSQPRTATYFYRQKQPFSTMNGLEKDFPFCSNPDCQLFVRAGDPGVMGSGNWAQLPDGQIVGRSLYNGAIYAIGAGTSGVQCWQSGMTG